MELYYIINIVNRDDAAAITEICRESGAALITTALGSGTATTEQLSIYGLNRTEKAIVSAVASADGKKQIFKMAKRKLYIDIPGNGITAAVPIKSVGGGRALAYLTENNVPTGGVPDMKFEYELIIIVLNEGFSDMVMDIARAAGASGGTVLRAKETETAKTEKFLGVSLVKEKDIIYIVSAANEKNAIMSAVAKNAGFGTDASAVCFSLPASSVAGLRKIDDD